MTSIKVRKDHFTGSSKVFSRERDALAAIVRGLAIDNARLTLQVAGVADLTDNTTGTAGSAIADLVLPSAAFGPFDATSAGGAQRTALNTSLGKIADASKVLVNSINNARARLGLAPLSQADGTQASANTLPALDLTATTSNGTSAVDYASAEAVFLKIKNNQRRLALAFNEVLVALGMTPLDINISGSDNHPNLVLASTPTIAASADGNPSVKLIDATNFLAAVANNFATMAYAWNGALTQGAITALTDSSGGTAALSLVANAAPAAADGAATTSAPKAGFDTQLNVIENAIAEIASKTNTLLRLYGMSTLTDSTAQSVNGTIELLSVNLTAVDGSSGTDAVDVTTAAARMATINNALSSLATKLNALAPYYGVEPITDSLGGTVSATLANIASTATGVSGAGATMLDTAVDAWLVKNRNNIATLAALLNAMIGTSVALKPLNVVAAQ